MLYTCFFIWLIFISSSFYQWSFFSIGVWSILRDSHSVAIGQPFQSGLFSIFGVFYLEFFFMFFLYLDFSYLDPFQYYFFYLKLFLCRIFIRKFFWAVSISSFYLSGVFLHWSLVLGGTARLICSTVRSLLIPSWP